MFNEFIELFSYSFVTRALIAGTLISLCAAVLGVVLVLKKYALIGHALADVGFASLSLALALKLSPIYVSFPLVILASFVIMFISQKKGVEGDIAIGVAATGSMAAGIIITSLTSGFNIDVSNYMFGSVLAMDVNDVYIGMILAVVILVVFVLMYNRLFIVTFDEKFAEACGINVTFYRFVISLLTAVTIVIGMRMMGTMLISSLVIFPAMSAQKIASSFKRVIISAGIISACCFVVGFFVSFLLNFPTGASVVVVNVVVLAILTLVKRIKTA